MTPLQRIETRAGEIRIRLTEIATDDLTEETRSELDTLRTEYADVERRANALRLAGDPTANPSAVENSDGRELRALIHRASVGAIFEAALEHRSTDGAERELQDHFHLSGNQVPLAMLLETRAVTPAPANVGQDQEAVIPQVFPDSVAAFLGVGMPVVGVGEHVFPVLTAGATGQNPAENTAINPLDDTGAFTADVLSPGRLQTSFLYSREDRARMMGLDAALRQNLSDALSDGLDDAVVAGTNGLLTGTNLDNNNVSTETTYALYREQFAYGRVDGKYASATSDLRVVMGSGTFQHAASQYRGNNDNTDGLMALGAAGIPVRVSAHVPAVASTKQNAIVRLGMRTDMVAPLWEGVTVINDEISKSAEGQIRLTAVLLYAVKIIRKAGFHKQQIQNA